MLSAEPSTDARHPLDQPVRASLLGAHAPLADRLGSALRYQPDVTPFVATPGGDHPAGGDPAGGDPAGGDPAGRDPATGNPVGGVEQTWRDLATLLGPDAEAVVAGLEVPPPDGWDVVGRIPGVQMVDDGVAAAPDDEAVRLGPADVPDMLALVERTRPGPFRPRTVELGGYLGIRRGGLLVAMAGERFHPPGWTEISAVCTDDTHRGQGLATRLTRAVAHGIRERGDTPFLHASAANTTAIRLYESLGFRLRARPTFVLVRVSAAAQQPVRPPG